MTSEDDHELLLNAIREMKEKDVIDIAKGFDIPTEGFTRDEIISELMKAHDRGDLSFPEGIPLNDNAEVEPEPQAGIVDEEIAQDLQMELEVKTDDEGIIPKHYISAKETESDQESDLHPSSGDNGEPVTPRDVTPQTTTDEAQPASSTGEAQPTLPTGDSQPSEELVEATQPPIEKQKEDQETGFFSANMKRVRATQKNGMSTNKPFEDMDKGHITQPQRAAPPTSVVQEPVQQQQVPQQVQQPVRRPQQQAVPPRQRSLSLEERQKIAKDYLQEVYKMRPDDRYGYIREDPDSGALHLILQLAPEDREKIVTMGTILQDMGNIPVNHPALTIKFALNLLNEELKSWVVQRYRNVIHAVPAVGGQPQ